MKKKKSKENKFYIKILNVIEKFIFIFLIVTISIFLALTIYWIIIDGLDLAKVLYLVMSISLLLAFLFDIKARKSQWELLKSQQNIYEVMMNAKRNNIIYDIEKEQQQNGKN